MSDMFPSKYERNVGITTPHSFEVLPDRPCCILSWVCYYHSIKQIKSQTLSSLILEEKIGGLTDINNIFVGISGNDKGLRKTGESVNITISEFSADAK